MTDVQTYALPNSCEAFSDKISVVAKISSVLADCSSDKADILVAISSTFAICFTV